jgi:hypothetical protein
MYTNMGHERKGNDGGSDEKRKYYTSESNLYMIKREAEGE